MSRRWPAVACCAALLGGASTVATPAGGAQTGAVRSAAVDPSALALGDGSVSTTPKVGNVFSCMTTFGNIGGAQALGPWINTAAKTWNSTTKLAVQGTVTWPNPSYSAHAAAGRRIVTTHAPRA